MKVNQRKTRAKEAAAFNLFTVEKWHRAAECLVFYSKYHKVKLERLDKSSNQGEYFTCCQYAGR